MEILTEQGRAALAAASLEADPGSLGAAGRMRKQFPPELAAAALTQVALRRRARTKLARADGMFLTPQGLEQATRQQVAAWRADQYSKGGVQEVYDLGCGIGADAMAFLEAGLRVHAVEADPDTAALATANLALVGGAEVQVARAEDVDVPESAAVFLDPARRTDRGRTWRVEDFSPPWSLVLHHLARDAFCCIKMGPGLPKELIPDGVRATWVSHHGDVVEASLWNGDGPARAAVVFPRDGGVPVELASDAPRELPVRAPGRFIIEPDNAVVRAGLVTEVQPGAELWLLDEHTAYLSSDDPVDTPLADCFEVVDVLDYDVAALRRYVAQHRIGTLEIKKRAIDVDPAALRRQLRPKGSAAATLILVRTPHGARAVVARRLRA
ncbi:MAG: class I SAM-dependent methyltransferase [Arachnia sp.]